ncbi:MAG: hypothetical protein QGI83_16840 [Candidatus Latescibacteria bacterium]|jgi:hypothetical protein|nr:hypothetical protein [Candidatus Latescibacterota bacterium]
MHFTQHALDKLRLYGLTTEEIVDGSRDPIEDLCDTNEQSMIKIIQVGGVLLALVIDVETGNLITVYRTDERTLSNRKRTGRWI